MWQEQWNHGFQSFGTGKVQAEVEYTETTFQLRADDVVIFYTDGLPEAMNSVYEEFDFERFEATLSSLQLNLLSAPEIFFFELSRQGLLCHLNEAFGSN